MSEKPTVSRASTAGIGRIVETPRLFPAACMITGRGDGPMVDFMKDFTPDHTGRMYVRVQVVKDLAVLVGMKTPEDYARMEEELADARADIAELTEQRDTAQDALDAVAALENTGFVVRHKADPATEAPAS